jgi:hypothetical protein
MNNLKISTILCIYVLTDLFFYMNKYLITQNALIVVWSIKDRLFGVKWGKNSSKEKKITP